MSKILKFLRMFKIIFQGLSSSSKSTLVARIAKTIDDRTLWSLKHRASYQYTKSNRSCR